jgi:hydrogenase maturation protein HypF
VGAELKNTFCLTHQDYAFVSHYIGDLQNYETLVSFEEGIAHFEKLFRIQPEIIACDQHPDYLATRYAQVRCHHSGLPLVQVQHHHAHLGACLAENGWQTEDPVIGLTFDGTGLGTDGAIWGGEVLLGNYASFERLYHLAYVPLPGGDSAVRHPARMALAHLWQTGIDWDPTLLPMTALCYDERTVLRTQLEHRINAPLTSSMGRLFDAVSSLIGVCQHITYEGQAAIELEMAVDPHENRAYPFMIKPGIDDQGKIIDPQPMFDDLITDWLKGIPVPILAARFHNGVARLAVEICQEIKQSHGVSTVALSGGVWQNRYLLQKTAQSLKQLDYRVLIHRSLPPNDGCIALGQALVAAHTLIRS